MRRIKYRIRAAFISLALAACVPWAATQAADDDSIQGDLRSNIHVAMQKFIDHQTIEGNVYLYDAVEGRLLKLRFDSLHKGIVKKGDFFVSCADFIDQDGRKVDVDFLVRETGPELRATQALIHSVAGEKRKYHLELM